MSVLVAGLAACEKKEGPAERAGKDIDKAIDKVGQQVEKAGEKIQDTASGNKK
jgi:predicted small secreted protein